MSIQHDHTLNPVTALEFYFTESETLIFAGEGCHLKVFDASTYRLLCDCKVFEDQAIHGIAARRHEKRLIHDDGALEVVIWGGSSLSVFGKKDITALLREEIGSDECDRYYPPYNYSTSDWIIDVAISPFECHECVLVTAHNTILRAKIQTGRNELIIETLSSPSRSILYSAHLIWESEESILVAAGTVFGEIIVWKCSIRECRSQVIHNFTGHEGSIFGVNISPIVDQAGSPQRLLASCSDDRTIRIWRLDLDDDLNRTLSEAIVAREIDFGGAISQREASNACLALSMGHMSRIWSVEFLIEGSKISILSFGEDATTHLWDLEDTNLTLVRIFAYHTGKHIWSRALLQDAKIVLATGGADGKISLFEISRHSSEQASRRRSVGQPVGDTLHTVQSQCWDTEEILLSLPQSLNSRKASSGLSQPSNDVKQLEPAKGMEGEPAKKTKRKKVIKDVVNRYAFVSEDQVILTTTFGRVVSGKLGACASWVQIKMPEDARDDLDSYSVARSIPNLGLVFLGCANGKSFAWQKGCDMIRYFGSVSSKIADVFPLYDGTEVQLLVCSLGHDVATLYQCGAEPTLDFDMEPKEQRLRLPERFVVTSAARARAGELILGSRKGSLAIYDSEGSDESMCTWESKDAADAITSIINLPELVASGHRSYILTTCRNGTYSIFSLTKSEPQINILHQGTPPFGPMIEAAWFSGSDLMLYGFKSKSFIVWNETKQYEVSSVECGGAHRSFAYSPQKGSNGAGYFVYTKASKLYLHSQNRPSHQIVKSGGHGREIKACAISDKGLIATGAEDTTIRIWRYRTQFECLLVVQKHTTGIQHLQWFGSNCLFSSGGNEEFFIWAVQEIPGFGIGLVCEASCPDQSEEKDLRIMSFDVSELEGPTTLGNWKALISLAYSDSTIRVYTYSKAEGFHLISRGRYSSSCLMKIRHLETRENELFFLTAATDGNLIVWKTRITKSRIDEPNVVLVTLSAHRVHQSSIKTLNIARKNNRILIGTGGDDNALAVTTYHDLLTAPKSVLLRSAHAAAITGLTFLSTSDGNKLRIVTSGNDQRIKEWELHLDAASYGIRKIGDMFTSIADVGDVSILQCELQEGKKKVLIVGNGMEVYEVSMKSLNGQ